MIFLILLLSFLFGSIPTAYLISKIFYGIDIRNYGSGNPGATNVYRTLGKKPGIITFVIDVLKGFFPVFISKKLFSDNLLIIPVISGFLAVLGHIWTPFLRFKGGKGVATGCGIFLGLAPLSAVLAVIVFVVVLIITKYVALGSISAAISLPIFLYVLKESLILVLIAILLAFIIVWRHKSNIRKILGGVEN
ncbi:MAG: glycerol-3-phosphate 1-O-acyltransferase PlsY [Elusimicrobia bacterium]|nr:glycerol-3-phosphate 1-O-acyltransferase PlsY [Elusimicrobiota bacterium]